MQKEREIKKRGERRERGERESESDREREREREKEIERGFCLPYNLYSVPMESVAVDATFQQSKRRVLLPIP